jgi:hypothetical protein
MMQLTRLCLNSMGSSIVMMWSRRFAVRVIDDGRRSVVDFPEPVGPVTRTRPFSNQREPAGDVGEPQLVDGEDFL